MCTRNDSCKGTLKTDFIKSNPVQRNDHNHVSKKSQNGLHKTKFENSLTFETKVSNF
jgi:hypothetical protein